MAMHKPAFKELAAALADEVASVGRRPQYKADCGAQQASSLGTGYAEHDSFAPVVDGMFEDAGHVFVEDWLEAQLLDCQNLARRHGLARLAGVLDEALDALLDERQGTGGAPAGWRA